MAITNGYCTLAELKTYLGISGSGQDTNLENAITTASRIIDNYCNRRFFQDDAVVTRTYTAEFPDLLYVHDISTTTGLVVKTDTNDDGTYDTTWTLNTDFYLMPLDADDGYPVKPWTALRIYRTRNTAMYFPRTPNRVEVQAKFGFASVPAEVKQATFIIATQIFKRKDMAFGTSGNAESGFQRTSKFIDADAQRMINTYRRRDLVKTAADNYIRAVELYSDSVLV